VAAFKPFFQVVGHKPARRYDYRAKGREQAWAMCLYRAFDSLGLCHFALLMGEPPFMAWLNAATGWEMDEAEFIRIGKRIQVLRHAFNARHGLPAQFPLPGRERGDPPLLEGPLRGKTLDLQAMAESYFETLGLDPRTGLPREEIRAELDLGWIREEGP
jgi:aldehyde:ferredoxin oxidoreductase